MVPEDAANKPLVIAFVADLMMTTRIENVINHLGYTVTAIADSRIIGSGVSAAKLDGPGEPVFGPEAVLMQKLTEWQPALLIFDLGNDGIPWRQWIGILKSAPATRRIPILAFGPHVDVEAITLAKELGAESVVARSRFTSALPELIEKYILIRDYTSLRHACQQPLSKPALQGLDEFNRHEYFEAHEYLEEAWNEDSTPGRELYRAVLQVAVAYLQIERGNYNGAIKMFLRARQWLEPLPDICRGIDIGRLKQDAEAVHEMVLQLGPDQLSGFDRSLFQPIKYQIVN
jgi:CheY-like chemotaxis protein